jgi:hypothetical protein
VVILGKPSSNRRKKRMTEETEYKCGKCGKTISEEEALATTKRAASVLASGWKKAEEALDYCNECYYALIRPHLTEICGI